MDKKTSGAKPKNKSSGRGGPAKPRLGAKTQAGYASSPKAAAPAPHKNDGTQYVVRGRVTGAPAGYIVRAYDKDLRNEEPLGKEVKLTGTGEYAIPYSPKQFKRAEKGSADLRVALCDSEGRELLTSGIHFNAPAETVVNLTLPS